MPNETRGRLVTDIYLLYKFLKILWKSPLVVIKLLEVRLQYCFVEKTFAKPIGFLWGQGFFLLKKKKKKGIQKVFNVGNPRFLLSTLLLSYMMLSKLHNASVLQFPIC